MNNPTDESSPSLRQQCVEAFQDYVPNDLAKFEREIPIDDDLEYGFHTVSEEYLQNIEDLTQEDPDQESMNQPLAFNQHDIEPIDSEIENRIRDLWRHVDKIWERNYQAEAFSEFVAADFPEVFRYLVLLRDRCNRMIEWGSGLGTVTIMASLLGYDAYGIEIQSGLVSHANHLAAAYGADCQFAQGSFIPDHYTWNPEVGDDSFRTLEHASDGYVEFGLELSDFDLIYAYPWQDEVGLFEDIARQCGQSGTLLLTYNSSEGVQLNQIR